MFEHFEFLSLTQLGKVFGVSAIQIGRWLVKLGLRENGQPTEKALEEGFVSFVEMDQMEFHSWHRIKTIAALAELGIKPVDQQNDQIMKPENLNLIIQNEQPPAQGPFILRSVGSVGLEFVDANGIVRLHSTDEPFANQILKLMNQAHEKLKWWA